MFKKIFIIAILLSLTNGILASGGGGGGGGGSMPTTSAPKLTPLELAIKAYRDGLKSRDKAWKYEARAAEADDDKGRKKFEKKAMKQFVRAQKKFKRALKKEPRLYQAHSSLGYTYRRLGDYDKSLAAYNEALRLNPKYTEAIEYRAEAYMALGQYDKTQTAYMRLFVEDREKADELMLAMLAWQEKTEEKNTAGLAFATWIDERHQLSMQTLSLSKHESADWQH